MQTASARTRLISQTQSERPERRRRRRPAPKRRSNIAGGKTSTKAAGRRILEGEEEREAKKKREEDEEQEVVISSTRSSPLREPYLPDNSNPPLELIEAFKLAKLRYREKEIRQDRMITLKFCGPSPLLYDPQLFAVFEPATDAVLSASRFLLGLSSTLGGKPLARCSGFWIDWDEENKTGIVLTTAHLILSKEPDMFRGGEYAADADVTVHLRDGNTTEGHLIYYQEHYDIAFFRVRADQPVQLPSFNDGVKSGQLVFRLGRDESANLRITHGRPGYMDPSEYERPHHMCLHGEVDDVQYIDGGPIIDLDAKVVGMVNDCGSSGSFIPSSILLKCLDLWKKFKFIPRPHLGLAYSVIKFLDPARVEKLSCKYNIDDGLIVKEVSEGSQAEELGIRRGDIIECFNGECISTPIQLENMLLSLCKSAGNGFDAKVHVSVGVFHTRELRRSTIELTVGVSDRGEVFERGYCPVTLGEGTSASSVSPDQVGSGPLVS